VLAGATSGVDAGRLARRHGCGLLLRAGPGTLQRMGALPALIDGLRLAREADVAAYRRGLLEGGIECATVSEPAYPERLRVLHDPPLALFWSGPRSEALDWPAPAAAIVGSRKASEAGLLLAQRLAGAVVEAGGVVVSGLALGIDAAAHRGAGALPSPCWAAAWTSSTRAATGRCSSRFAKPGCCCPSTRPAPAPPPGASPRGTG
jgi:DNA processing protein